MVKPSVLNSLLSFTCGLLVGFACHIYYANQLAAKRKGHRAKDLDQDEVHSELERIYSTVLSIQRRLDVIGTDADQTAADQIDTAPREVSPPLLASDEIFYDTAESIDAAQLAIVKVPNDVGNGDSCSVKTLFAQVDDNLENGSCNRETLYEQLKRHIPTQSNEPNFWWRLAKTAHFLSKSEPYLSGKQEEAKKRLLYEGLHHAQKALELDDQNGDCHKWYAITLGCLNDYVTTKEKITNGMLFKEHLDIAMSLKPDDPTLYYLAGRFCMELSSLSWIERKLASTFFGELPPVTQQDALDYFYKAHQLRGCWLENIQFIIEILVALKDYVQARKYLKEALAIDVSSSEDVDIHEKLLRISKSVQ